MICTVHDEIGVEVKEDIAEQFAEFMKSEMVRVGNKYVTKVTMEVEITIDNHWKK